MDELLAADWKMIEAQLPREWRQMAIDLGALQESYPPQLGAKIVDASDLLRLLMLHIAADESLRTATASAAAGGIVAVSPVALHKRMRTAGPWMGMLYAHMVKDNVRFDVERWAGYEVIGTDASTVTRPGAKGTTARLHYALRLTDLAPVGAFVTDETGGETFRRFDVKAGQLWMGDRGYSNPPGVAWVKDGGGDALVRYNRGAMPVFDHRGKRIDVMKRLRGLHRRGVPVQWRVFVHPKDHAPIKGRLCVLRLPKDEAQVARERVRREEGSSASAETLEAAEYVMLFATAPEERLCLHLLFELYRLRWQLELAFKRSKSIEHLGRLPNFRADTIHSWIVGKLLCHELAARLATDKVAFPPGGRRRARVRTQGPQGAGRGGRECRA